MVLPGVSIVTTTWNEKESIKKIVSTTRNVLQRIPHEIIVVDDNSPDRTIQVAQRLADVAVTKKREGQTKGLLHGMRLAKYSVIVTIDADLENDPELIPELVKQTAKYHMVLASRNKLPRISEKIASKTLGKLVGVTDAFSNFRAVRKEVISNFTLKGGETFGAEFQITAKKKGLKIGEIKYDPPPRRKNPRARGVYDCNIADYLLIIKFRRKQALRIIFLGATTVLSIYVLYPILCLFVAVSKRIFFPLFPLFSVRALQGVTFLVF
jgi:dolichol-phosphate mannosyltransferase